MAALLFSVAACGDSRPVAPSPPVQTVGPAEYAAIDAAGGLEPLEGDRVGAADAFEADDPLAAELANEREAQLDLPKADDPLWGKLRQTRIAIDERSQLYTAVHPAAVRSLAGTTVTVKGYMMPLESTDRTTHFIISPYTPVCFFHPPAEPNEVIEVRTDRPIEAGYNLVEVTGVLQLANDGEKGLFFVISEGSARILERVDA